ncbi:secondary thiamine-phosphate synthase enzyme YjbQ [Phenylobacterium sp.]|uniref:secondary thiamine-phosphate synthase enzyme YjbQ n=1 Tax=Phenylobacterium sp. TaxID=1871053 RepID=UPI002FC97392
MRQALHTLDAPTSGAGLTDITPGVAAWVEAQRMAAGLLTVFCRHTSASLVIQGVDADMKADLEAFFVRLAPEGEGLYTHLTDGPDDMPAHIRAALTQTQIAVPVVGGRLALGKGQAIYVFEHRRAPQRRQVLLHLIGE